MIDIKKYKDELIQKTSEIIKIPSVHEESENPEVPFGEETKKALEYILKLGENLGFRTKNIDNYCGYIEFGEGKEMLGIIGHLDVVPVGDGWKHRPFEAIIEDGKIFGRGAIDDKGPVMAALYAMKAVREQVKINKRVRLILGLNEERDWKCIEYYKRHEESPTVGFSPDADFPCIYAEKGLLTVWLKQQNEQNQKIIITDIDCNSNAINVVPKYCKIELKINSKAINKKELLEYILEQNEKNIEIKEDNDKIILISHGIASHAAHPDLGLNAISMLIILVNKIFNKFDINIELFETFSKLIGMQYNGENLGIGCEDESGKLTLNVGNIKFNKNNIEIGMNLRIPVTTKIEDIENKFKNLVIGSTNLQVDFNGKKEPLYIDKDDKLIKTLCETFTEVTGKKVQPIAIGGATYARAFKNCVSFGANMPGNKDMCHQADEFIEIDNLVTSCQIYAEAIYKLSN